jgi:Tetracyclin repressor-like, C-terminal domain
MFDLSQPDKPYPELERAQTRARRTMTDYVKALVAADYLAGDPEMLGQIFWAMVHGLVVLELAGKLDPKPDFATLHRTALRLLMHGAQIVDQRESRRAR